MQLNGQNINHAGNQPQFNCNYNCNCAEHQVPQTQYCTNPQYGYQYYQYPQNNIYPPQPCNPGGATAVNININNPTVSPNGYPTGGLPPYYPGVYYPGMPLPGGATYPTGYPGGSTYPPTGGENPVYPGTNPNPPASGTDVQTSGVDTSATSQTGGANNTEDGNQSGNKTTTDGKQQTSGTQETNGTGNGAGNETAKTDQTNSTTSETTSNGQNSSSSETTTTTDTSQKTEKRKVIELTDDYIRNLENYLNSNEKEIRLSGAKEVLARLEEDPSRKDDKALTALINKMLQDPSEEIKLIALTALESRVVTGDKLSVELLKKMQNSDSGFGQDAIDASRILLQMSGKQVEKEVPITETKKTKTEKKTTKE
ncbi:hypothetical protein IJ579_02435 [bacterium]|nr:hypothetical protein [bacterium]